MVEKKTNGKHANHQHSLEQLIESLAAKAGVSTASSNELTRLIDRLTAARDKVIKKEEASRRQKEKAEAKRRLEQEKAQHNAHIEQVTSMDLPLDWENAFLGDERTQGVHVNSISDGLIMSLSNLARVDIEYISAITGEDYKTVIAALKGSIYQNPETWEECFYKGWETAEEYLSGNLMRKWKKADEANKAYRDYFKDNISTIEKVFHR